MRDARSGVDREHGLHPVDGEHPLVVPQVAPAYISPAINSMSEIVLVVTPPVDDW